MDRRQFTKRSLMFLGGGVLAAAPQSGTKLHIEYPQKDIPTVPIWPNGFHVHGDCMHTGRAYFDEEFSISAETSFTGAVNEMLLQGWGGRLQIFPAMREKWQDASFLNLRSESGYLVSAEMRKGGVMCATTESEKGRERRQGVGGSAVRPSHTGACSRRAAGASSGTKTDGVLGGMAMRGGLVLLTLAVLACGTAAWGIEKESVAVGRPFGKSPEGQAIRLFTLKNGEGMEVGIMTWGATLVSLKVADVEGRFDDVVLGFDGASGYFDRNPFFGALTGRYANRIARGRFAVNGREYKLSVNDGENTLHGGSRGFDKRLWTVLRVGPDLLELRYVSPDGEEGFPGELTATVRYTLTADNELRIDCGVTTDKDTVQNLGSHPYFNLAGESNGTILDQELEINADHFTPVDPHRIPTGEIRSVEGTPMDFRKPMRIGARIDADDEQLKNGMGYDENFVLNRTGTGLILAARLRDPHSGRVMELLTTEPGLQMYSGNFLDGKLEGKGGKTYRRYGGLVLEAQHFPDSPNHPNFPSTELKARQTYRSTTVYRFSVAR